jgi:ubiquinone/menaquinone biosynthesis C-methylase UbiE
MNMLQAVLIIIGVVLFILVLIALPRKKNERVASMEGIDDTAVVIAFEKMNRTPPFILLRNTVVSKLRELKLTGTLVDLGCGSGRLLLKLAKSFPDLTLIGVDISKEILDVAEQNVKKQIKEKIIEFKLGDAIQLPFDDHSIETVVSSLSLHHWTEPEKALFEIYRILKPGGQCIIFDFRRDSRRFFYGLLTFATKLVVPKALKNVNEPLGSLKSSYTINEIKQEVDKTSFANRKIDPYLAWMFIKLQK